MVISLSHRAGVAACAVALSGVALGCDLETVEPRSDGFVADYFTGEEQGLIAQAPVADRFRLVALLWSGKESALKALRVGLRSDTRALTVRSLAPLGQTLASTWYPLQIQCADGQAFTGWWQDANDLLRTVVAALPSAPPIPLLHGTSSVRPDLS
jgi:4'-phosphopantetheinyl transferase